MKETIKVQMTEEALYDFLLYHTYSKFSGFLINILGMTVVLLGIYMWVTDQIAALQLVYYILAGVVFLIFTPISLWLRAKKCVKRSAEYKTPKVYIFSEEGIDVVQTAGQRFTWEEISKVVAAPKTFGFYYGDNDALIIPKSEFGDKYMAIMKIVSAHICRSRMKLR